MGRTSDHICFKRKHEDDEEILSRDKEGRGARGWGTKFSALSSNRQESCFLASAAVFDKQRKASDGRKVCCCCCCHLLGGLAAEVTRKHFAFGVPPMARLCEIVEVCGKPPSQAEESGGAAFLPSGTSSLVYMHESVRSCDMRKSHIPL